MLRLQLNNILIAARNTQVCLVPCIWAAYNPTKSLSIWILEDLLKNTGSIKEQSMAITRNLFELVLRRRIPDFWLLEIYLAIYYCPVALKMIAARVRKPVFVCFCLHSSLHKSKRLIWGKSSRSRSQKLEVISTESFYFCSHIFPPNYKILRWT